MAGKWWTKTWSPIVMRCTRVTEGCDNCWHLRYANRLLANPKLPGEIRDAYAGGAPVLRQDILEQPLHWRKPQQVFTQGMGDLFHDAIPEALISHVVETLRICTQHTFYVLTKRPRRALDIFDTWTKENSPLPDNLWLGVSAENQARADERIPILLRIPVAHRFVSLEPLLGPIVLRNYLPATLVEGLLVRRLDDRASALSWIIAGAETGPGARPANPAWFRSLRNECNEAGVSFWLKAVDAKGNRELDGQEWNERP